jgi:phosphonopyruvate decarboxylase
VFCLDGDGALLMHMGNMATVGQQNLANYKHIVINNGAHDSVGAQPTDAHDLEKFNLTELAKACGYKMVRMLHGDTVVSACVFHLCD